PVVIGSVDAPSVVINEILYNGGQAVLSEDWVELHNPTADSVHLAGWYFGDEGNRFNLPGNAVLEPGGFLVLARDRQAFRTWYPSASGPLGDLGFGFSAAGETLRLVSDQQVVVDSVSFTPRAPWPVAADGQGYTLALQS